MHPLVLELAGRAVQSSYIGLSFEWPLALSVLTLLAVVGAVLLASLGAVQALARVPGGWLLAGRPEARGALT